LAKHFIFYFQHLGVSFSTWSRHDGPDLLKEKIKNANFVGLAVSDASIGELFEQYLKNSNVKAFHFSGAFHHPEILSFHPLMTFSDELYDLEFYKKIHFAVSDSSAFKKIFPLLSNPYFTLSNEDKGLYHAWAVLLGAGTQNHLKSGLQAFAKIGVPESATLVYLEKIFQQFINHKGQSITGPWVRNDQSTIEKNLNALSLPDQNLYKNLMERTSK